MVRDGVKEGMSIINVRHSLYVNDFYTCIMLSYSCLISHADDRGHVWFKFLKGATGVWGRRVLYSAGLIVHMLLMGKWIHW